MKLVIPGCAGIVHGQGQITATSRCMRSVGIPSRHRQPGPTSVARRLRCERSLRRIRLLQCREEDCIASTAHYPQTRYLVGNSSREANVGILITYMQLGKFGKQSGAGRPRRDALPDTRAPLPHAARCALGLLSRVCICGRRAGSAVDRFTSVYLLCWIPMSSHVMAVPSQCISRRSWAHAEVSVLVGSRSFSPRVGFVSSLIMQPSGDGSVAHDAPASEG